MSRYEIGAIYEIEAGEKKYYARLLSNDLYGVFEPIQSETEEHRQKQITNLKKMGFDVSKYQSKKK